MKVLGGLEFEVQRFEAKGPGVGGLGFQFWSFGSVTSASRFFAFAFGVHGCCGFGVAVVGLGVAFSGLGSLGFHVTKQPRTQFHGSKHNPHHLYMLQLQAHQ